MADEFNIPQKHVDFCRALCRVAREHAVGDMTLQFTPGFGDAWRDSITMSWTQGRHGAAQDQMIVQSTVTIRTTIEDQFPFEKGLSKEQAEDLTRRAT